MQTEYLEIIPARLNRVLVPLDFSAHSMKALSYARLFAAQFGATVVLLHVSEPVVYGTDFGYAPVPPTTLEHDCEEAERGRLEGVAEKERAAGVNIEVAQRVGRPHLEIVDAARELKADLILVTTHGYTGLKHVLLGSTAELVVRHAPCPVLVVRDQVQSPVTEPEKAATGEVAEMPR